MSLAGTNIRTECNDEWHQVFLHSPNMGYTYCIRNMIIGKRYVGQTTTWRANEITDMVDCVVHPQSAEL